MADGPFSPCFTPRSIRMGIKAGRYQLTPEGLEKRCIACKEFWPADTEFFYLHNSSRFSAACKACYEYYYRGKTNG